MATQASDYDAPRPGRNAPAGLAAARPVAWSWRTAGSSRPRWWSPRGTGRDTEPLFAECLSALAADPAVPRSPWPSTRCPNWTAMTPTVPQEGNE
jgi:hypothetical protein